MFEQLKIKFIDWLYKRGYVLMRNETWHGVIEKIKEDKKKLALMYKRIDTIREVEKKWYYDKIGNIRAIREISEILSGDR